MKSYQDKGESGSKARACEGITGGNVAILVFILIGPAVIRFERRRKFRSRQN